LFIYGGAVSKVVLAKIPPEDMGVRLRCMKEIFLHQLTDLRILSMVIHPEILPCAGWKSTPPARVRMTITPLPVILKERQRLKDLWSSDVRCFKQCRQEGRHTPHIFWQKTICFTFSDSL
jgi:hypothetical protein